MTWNPCAPQLRALCLAFGLVLSPALAQEDPAPAATRLEEIANKLNLTEDQKTALKPILEKEVADLKAVKVDTSVGRLQKLKRIRAIDEEATNSIKAVLTEEQWKKYEVIRKENRKALKARIQARKGSGAVPNP